MVLRAYGLPGLDALTGSQEGEPISARSQGLRWAINARKLNIRKNPRLQGYQADRCPKYKRGRYYCPKYKVKCYLAGLCSSP